MSELSVSKAVHRNVLWLAGTLMATVLSGCETANTGFSPQADFKTMPSDQVLSLLRNANQITVTTAGTDIHEEEWLKERISNCNGKSNDLRSQSPCFDIAGHANNAGNFFDLMRGNKPNQEPDERAVRFAMAALLRGCGIYASSPDSGEDRTCNSLAEFLYAIGNPSAAAAVWEQAEGCYSYSRGSPVNRCFSSALFHRSVYASDPQRLTVMARQACNTIHDRDACEYLLSQGQRVDMNAVAQAESDRHQAHLEFNRQVEADSERAKADAQASRNAIFSTLQSLPGGSDPNAILNAGNQQATAMRAIGDANAGRQQQTTQMHLASQRSPLQTTNQGTNIVAGPAIAAQGSAQVVTSSPGAQSNVSNSNSSVASGAVQYSTPLATSCVRQFWDPNTYNWLSFENNCGQAIYLNYMPHRPGGWAMGGGMHLAPGNHNNTGLSSAEINQTGGFDLYVCPTDSVPVDLSGNILKRNVSQYRCKPE
jgi:hypothetical protein